MKILNNIFVIVFFFLAVIVSQHYYDTSRSKRPKDKPVILPASVVKAADLGLDNAVSDFYWLSSIQYFGERRADYSQMDDLIKLTNDLDPRFSYPYAFAVLVLPEIKMTDQALEIGQRGVKEADPNWKIPYYTATTYHINKADIKNAAKYFDIAANTAGAPEGIKRITASYSARPDLREQTKQIWIGIMENSNDEVVRERAKAYVYHYELLDLLEQSAKIFKENFGAYPEPIEELFNKKILKAIPEDPFGFKYSIDQDGRARIKQ